MAELQARLAALERRMERAEAALRLQGVPVLFEDVAVRFSRQEWASLDEGQRELYRSVMEGNYEMLMSLYCALSKPELLLQLEREDLSTPPELEPEVAEVSPELAGEPAPWNCTSHDPLLETETMERSCRETRERGNVAEKSGNLVEESKNLVEESRSLVEISENLTEESENPVEESRSLAEISGNLTEQSKNLVEESESLLEISGNLVEEIKNLVEESRSLVEISGNLTEESENPVEESRSPAEENRSLAKECRSPAEESGNLMEESRSPVVPESCSTRPVPLEAGAVPADLGQLTPSPPRPLSVHCGEAVGQSCSPPAAGDAEAGIPTEVPQEEVAAGKPSMPKTPSKGLEEDKGLEEEAVKDSGHTGQDLMADIPEEAGEKVTPAVSRMEQADPSPGEPEKDSFVGRPGACQRNAPRGFYSCPICRKTFLLKINLLIHQRGHTNWVPYVCVHCDRKFMSKKKIRRHLRAWAVNGTCQPSELEVCPSQVPCPASHPQTWAANSTCQPSDAKVCPSQGPCPASQCPKSQPQNWAPNGSCQPLDAKACPSQGTLCPTSQPQKWAPNGTFQASDAKACPSQGTLCPTSQPQSWAANGTFQASDAKVCPSQGPCQASQPQSWAASGTCQASKPEECPSQTLCPSSQPQAPSRECGKVWQEPGPARCSLSPGKMMYTCNECLETFSNQVFLTVHQRRHTGHHLILCPCCNRSFTWVSDFVRQHWTHMGVRPHQCGICQKTFKRFSHLKAHQRIHRRQQQPFACPKPVPMVAAPAAGDGVGSQGVTPQGWDAAVRP